VKELPGPPAPLAVWPAKVWPLDRTAGAPLKVPIAAAVAGILGTCVLYGLDEPGLGVPVAAAGILLAALATRPGGPTRQQIGWAVLTFALFGVSVVRAAEWLDWLCGLVGLLTGLLTVTNGKTWTGLLAGVIAGPAASVRTFTWTLRGLRPPVRGRRLALGRAAVVAVISVAVLAVFGALFASADPVFGGLVAGLVPSFEVGPLIVRLILFGIICGLALVGACLAAQEPRLDEMAPGGGKSRARLEWAVPLAALVALFACFVGVQLVVLADGARHVLKTAGLTYADYARQGFWQLLAVSALTLLVIAAVAQVAARESKSDRATLRWLLGALCVLALLVVASALRRMWLYEQAYGFTRLRLLVQFTEGWLGLTFVLVCAAGGRLRASWLPRTVVATGALTLLALATVNPDGFIAGRAVDRFTHTGRIDVGYLSGLSPDAAPALSKLPQPQRRCATGYMVFSATTPEPWYGANLGRERAEHLGLKAMPYGC
jgi:hypothetical protein